MEIQSATEMESPARYTRAEMEALRFADTAEQSSLWKSVYKALDSAVRKDYDDLSASRRIRSRPAKNQLSPPIPAHSGEDDDTVVEGEEIDGKEDDDSDDEVSIQRPAFYVEGEPNFDSGPPEDGLEYLRRVRWEAARIPKFRVAKLDKSKLKKEQSEYMPMIPEISKCPEHLLPSKEWEQAFLAEFSQLRNALSRLDISSFESFRELQSSTFVSEERCSDILSGPVMLDGSENIESDVPDFSDPGSETEDHYTTSAPVSTSSDRIEYPMLSGISKMDSVARVSMLKKRITAFQDMSTLTRNDCLWLFSLCAVVDAPLGADTCASLRSLLRKSANLLAEKSELDDEVAMLNILTTISGRYFGQLEF